MLTYIYSDGEQIARYGDAHLIRVGTTIYLDDNVPYVVNEVQHGVSTGATPHKFQSVYVSRYLGAPTPPGGGRRQPVDK